MAWTLNDVMRALESRGDSLGDDAPATVREFRAQIGDTRSAAEGRYRRVTRAVETLTGRDLTMGDLLDTLMRASALGLATQWAPYSLTGLAAVVPTTGRLLARLDPPGMEPHDWSAARSMYMALEVALLEDLGAPRSWQLKRSTPCSARHSTRPTRTCCWGFALASSSRGCGSRLSTYPGPEWSVFGGSRWTILSGGTGSGCAGRWC